MKTTHSNSRSQAWICEFGPVCCGRVVEIGRDGQPYVDFPGNPNGPIAARHLDTFRLECRASVENLPVLLVFEHGDPAKPILVGIVESGTPVPNATSAPAVQAKDSRHAVVDGRRVVLKGDEEVTLTCGKASITLTKDGRISLRGVEIVSRASGANKIRGASVSIN